MWQFLKNVVTRSRQSGLRPSRPRPGLRVRLNVETMEERLTPSAAPTFTGDVFYLYNYRTHATDRLQVAQESPNLGNPTRTFVARYTDTRHGFTDVVTGSITSTGVMTPTGVPISTISFNGGLFGLTEHVSFTGLVYGAGYSASNGCAGSNVIQGTLTLAGFFYHSNTYLSGTDYNCLIY
jgi:hypothetical protein